MIKIVVKICFRFNKNQMKIYNNLVVSTVKIDHGFQELLEDLRKGHYV